jgi:hypothetical protein
MEKVEGKELEEEELTIPPLQTTFPRSTKLIRSGITNLYISALGCKNKEQLKKVKSN